MWHLETVSCNFNNELQTSKPWVRYFWDAEARFYFMVWDFPIKVLEILQSNHQENFKWKKALWDTHVKCLYVHKPKSDILDIDSPKIYIWSFQETYVCLQKSGHQQKIINMHNRWRQKRKICKLTRWFLPHHLVLKKCYWRILHFLRNLKWNCFQKETFLQGSGLSTLVLYSTNKNEGILYWQWLYSFKLCTCSQH